MKILLVNNLYKPFNRGGAEKIVNLQADGLSALGHEVVIATSQPWGAKILDDGIIRFSGLAGSFFYLSKVPFFLRPLWHALNVFNFFSALKFYYLIKSRKIELVIGHNLVGLGFMLPWAAYFAGARYWQVVHDIQLLHPSGLMYYGKETVINSVVARIYQKINKILFWPTELIISPSNWLLGLLNSHGLFNKSKGLVLRNPILIAKHNDLELKKAALKTFTFLYVGQLERHKGVELLIAACSGLHGNWRLLVVGTGSLEMQLKKTVKDKRVDIVGWPGLDKYLDYYEQADLLVVSSTCYENSPTVIYEAAAYGLPVIGSNLGGIAELIKDKDFLFEPDNIEALRQKMTWALESKNEINVAGQVLHSRLLSNKEDEYYLKLQERF